MEYLDPESFFSIFLSSAMVILFGAAYAILYTMVKMNIIAKKLMPLAYLSWVLLVVSMQYLGMLIKSDPYTQKVLFGAMVGYLIFPHVVYFLLVRTHKDVKH